MAKASDSGGGHVSRTTMTKANNILETGASSMKAFKDAGWKPKVGFQLRYIYFLDPTARKRLTVPILPFSEIDRRGAGMYLGKPRVRSVDGDTPAIHAGEGGSIPTRTLCNDGDNRQPLDQSSSGLVSGHTGGDEGNGNGG